MRLSGRRGGIAPGRSAQCAGRPEQTAARLQNRSDGIRSTMAGATELADTDTKPQAACRRTVNLALQGVGSHGAFTWGVLDRLLEDERLVFDGISATSAGAVNAVVLASGLAAGGREGAKSALRNYWRRLSEMTSTGIFQPSLLDQMSGNFGLDLSPGFMFVDALSHFFSPYELNPIKYNPFK